MNAGREYPPDAAPLRPPRPTAVLLRPVALRGRVPGRDARFAAFPCAFAPHPPAPLLPQGEKGEFGLPEAQNEKRNAGTSKKPTPARRPAAPLCPAAPCTGAALLRPPPQRSCALPRSAPAPLKTTGAGGGADASTRGFGGRPPWVAAQSGVAPSDTANAALRQPPLPNPTGPSTEYKYSTPMPQCGIEKRQF